MRQPEFILYYKCFNDSIKTFTGNISKRFFEVSHARTFGKGINKHAASRGFQIITSDRCFVRYLKPHTGSRILVFFYRRGEANENLYNFISPRIIFGNVIQNIYQGHGVPAHGSAPEFRRLSRKRISPMLLFTFIPSMVKQASFRISCMVLHPYKLIEDVVKVLHRAKYLRILGIKKVTHIKSVEPHLIGVPMFVPKAALFGSRLPG